MDESVMDLFDSIFKTLWHWRDAMPILLDRRCGSIDMIRRKLEILGIETWNVEYCGDQVMMMIHADKYFDVLSFAEREGIIII